ncbi:M20 family metallopeptidase [Clostridium sp. D2Q-14]|uniref:M20 family metallopeptidase n=1 Tax=Anaeromonas gelatinilytica TaxID=2683194 RepID=UPI00193BB8E7|nr:M20 family metallopeptidase [Anaeromonas gelatinilytica]MBS4536469.1 M20 family metallopeptidase [Anaeromonas gelatinilytica]
MNYDLKKAFEEVDTRKDEVMDLYKEFVNRESWSGDLPAVKRFSDFLKYEMEKEGFECKYVEVGRNADTLVGILGKDRPGKPILFCGHMDTVFPTGMFEENPFLIKDGKAYGPGVLDMKGGILIALNVVKTLNRMGYKERPIKFCFSGDEEINHTFSKGAEVMEEEAKGCLCAFNMETGLIDNYLCIGRKGCLRYSIRVDGVETHSGNDFQGGRSSIVEMAYKIIDLHNITDIDVGTTVNIGTIKGGTIPNAVPAHCEVVVDMRYTSLAEKEKLLEGFKKACEATYIEGTTTTYSYLNKLDVFERTSEGLSFFNFVKEVAAKYDLDEINGRTLGGGSDAASTTMAGVPTICSCGVRGQWNHTEREYAIVDSIFERTKLYTAAVVNIDSFDTGKDQ